MSYPGSKGQAGVWQRIIGQMRPHSVYVEPFFGTGKVFRHKRPAQRSIIADKLATPEFDQAAALDGVEAHLDCGIAVLTRLQMRCELPSDAVIYCDPPYVFSTRQGRRYYTHEMTDEQHEALLYSLNFLNCDVLLSGVDSALYSARLKPNRWRCIRYKVRWHNKTAVECLWMNFPEPVELHDWRFAGFTYRERFAMNRFVNRWFARIGLMPPRKRQFVLNQLAATAGALLQRNPDPRANGGVGDRSALGGVEGLQGLTPPPARPAGH
jgi:DNA adenine methylase